MGIIAAGQITVVDVSDAPVLNAFITASRPTTQVYSQSSGNYNPSYASTPQVLTLNLTKAGSTASIVGGISSVHWYVVDGASKTEITSNENTTMGQTLAVITLVTIPVIIIYSLFSKQIVEGVTSTGSKEG